MTGEKSRPEILHIGFSKCGSTYLRSLFRAHSKAHLVFKSGFFTPLSKNGMTFAEYESMFVNEPDTINIESDEHLTLPCVHPELGVKATNLEEFERVARRIKEHLPEVKIIMVIRNQASLILSRYSEFLVNGGNVSFQEFVSKLMGMDEGNNQYYQNYYFQVIKILEKYFPKQNLLFLTQEEMRKNLEAVSTKIREFISLNGDFELKKGFRSQRKGLSVGAIKILSFLNGFFVNTPSFGGEPPDTKVPHFAYKNLVRVIRVLDFFLLSRFSTKSSSMLDEELKRAILSQFHEDNLNLQSYFDKELIRSFYLN